MFTQRHFISLADLMRADRPEEPRAYWQWRLTVNAMAILFTRHNPRFDHDRFMRACGAE
jgi:hypothetical protein